MFISTAAFCATILLLSVYVFLLRTPPLIISEATTRITGPLTADGQIDFFKALEERIYPPELATDDNGFRDFVRLFGHVGDPGPDWEFYRLQKYEKLGLDPNVPPTLTLPPEVDAIVANFHRAKGESIPSEYLWGKPWTLEEFPTLADWVNDIDTPLDAIAEAIRKPIFFSPLLQSPGAVQSEGDTMGLCAQILPDIQFFRSVARRFQARAMYRVGHGDINGAIDDKLAVYRLGRLIPQKRSLIEYLVGLAIEGMAMAMPVGANPEYPLTESQIRQLLDGFDALPPLAPLRDTYEWERLYGLSYIQVPPRNPWVMSAMINKKGTRQWFGIASYFCNWNIVYRRMNEMYDAMQEPPPRVKFYSLTEKPEPTAWENFVRLWHPNNRGKIVADTLVSLMASAIDVIEEATHRSQCAENMQRLALAILLYRCENGKFPDENWAAQIEKYLGENPQRYFSCPTSPSPDGETTYALVQYGDTVTGSPDLLLLVELAAPVPLDKAVIFADDVLACKGTGSLHSGGMNAACHNTAVRFLLSNTDAKELERLLRQR